MAKFIMLSYKKGDKPFEDVIIPQEQINKIEIRDSETNKENCEMYIYTKTEAMRTIKNFPKLKMEEFKKNLLNFTGTYLIETQWR